MDPLIRTTKIDGKEWYFGVDVAQALKYQDPYGAVKEHVMKNNRLDYADVLINQTGVLDLIFNSDTKGAKTFKRYLTSVLLPELRRRGSEK